VTDPGDGAGPTPARARRWSWRRETRHGFRRLSRRLVHWLGPAFLRTLSRTWRFTVVGAENLPSESDGARGQFMTLWHGRMLLGLPHHSSRGWSVLVSDSQDGDISRALLERFGYRAIRGSTTRGGARALREMLTVLGEGAVLIITLDGPRGPRHSMNPGLAWMAKATGYPIIPIGFAMDRAWRMRSWDRFTIPKPWARVVMVYGAPMRVERSADEATLMRVTDAVRDAVIAAEQHGFDLLGVERDW